MCVYTLYIRTLHQKLNQNKGFFGKYNFHTLKSVLPSMEGAFSHSEGPSPSDGGDLLRGEWIKEKHFLPNFWVNDYSLSNQEIKKEQTDKN